MKFFLLLLLLACSTTTHRLPSQIAEQYDEIYDENGEVRQAYKNIWNVYEGLDPSELKEFRQNSLADFSGDNALLPLPRVLNQHETEFLRRGVEQRGRALSLFLQDIHSDNPQITKIIPKEILDKILARSGEELFNQSGSNSPDSRFYYGPDIIRGPPTEKFPNGVFYVIEDNPGFVGGLGDLILAQESLLKNLPEYEGKLTDAKPENFYSELAKNYKDLAKKNNGIAVIAMYPNSRRADNEDGRVEKIFSELHIKTINVAPYSSNQFIKGKKIEANDDGVWLLEKNKKGDVKRTRVGHLLTLMDPSDIDLTHEKNRHIMLRHVAEDILDYSYNTQLKSKVKKALNSQAENKYARLEKLIQETPEYKAYKYSGIPGLLNAFEKGQVSLSNSPGTEFIGDKELYIYVEKMIEFYLKETPLLKNIPSGHFMRKGQNGKMILSPNKLDSVFNDIEKYVIKGADGRGGDAVWIGSKARPQEIEKLKKMIINNPGRYIFQEFTPLSTMGEYIGDLRLLSEVGPDKVITAPVPWGRVNTRSGSGKVNLSGDGVEVAVMVRNVNTKLTCQKLIQLISQ
jgi:uncharacterized circularly permuted ATP-grasp superfamily protein